jgi:hypothetical protein
MKSEGFRRTKAVIASGVIALAVAALTFGAASAVLRPASSPLAAASGRAFTVSSVIYSSPACSGSTVLLYPGVTDCAVLTVHNNLTVPITVQNLSTTIPTTPIGCPASNFSLPSFGGNMSVAAGATVSTSGLPISLLDSGTNQDACQGTTVNFSYTGSAQFTDGTSTALSASPNPPTSLQPVTLRAEVTGANAANDPSTPTGTVSFNSCSTSACGSRTALGSGTIGSSGVATLTTSSLSTGVHFVQAVYGGSGTDYTDSTSPVLTLTVGAPVTSAGTTTNGSGTAGIASTGGAKTLPSTSSPLAFTGADIAGMVVVALLMIGAGTFLVITVRRRRKASVR